MRVNHSSFLIGLQYGALFFIFFLGSTKFSFAHESDFKSDVQIESEDTAEPTEEEKPLTQSKYAVAIGVGWLHDYPGAEQGRIHFLPFPIFRGDTFRMDRIDGVSGRVYQNTNWRFSWSFIFQFPTESKDIPIRVGMPNLDWMLSIGPMMERNIWATKNQRLFIRFPLRLNTCTNFSTQTRFCGIVFNPGLRYSRKTKKLGEFIYRFEAFGHSQEYNRYYYQVTHDQSRPNRPAYHPESGFLGFVSGLIHTIPFQGWELVTALNYYDYGLAANRDSPLFKTPTNYSIFIAVTVDL